MNEASVLFQEHPTSGSGDRRIGVAVLNRPGQLNALNLEMCSLMLERFRRWQSDEGIVAVVLMGAGEKGFCSGGDVATVIREVRQGGPARFVYGDAFFTVEYELDLLIHRFGKPFVSVAHAVTMGGGVGLTVGASHRVVSERLKMAMPEIHIGLFPDVGGGWFLNRTPPGVGLLMAMTGLIINESDAILAGLADWCLADTARTGLVSALAGLDWSGSTTAHHAVLDAFFEETSLKPRDADGSGRVAATLLARLETIRALAHRGGPVALIAALQALATGDDWWTAPARSLAGGSPTAAALTWDYMRRCRLLSLQQTLELDLVLAKACQRGRDFPEGVRALLIDKDRKPAWSPADPADVDPAFITSHFMARAMP